MRGAVYVRSDAVNSVQMWHDYWPHVDVVDRELSYAAEYGFNMVQVYLHWIVWDRHKDEYLKRIDDFLSRASKYGLKVNLDPLGRLRARRAEPHVRRPPCPAGTTRR